MPSQAVAIGYAAFGGIARVNAVLFRALGNSPRDTIGLAAALVAGIAIVSNALYMQPGPHPAPIFSVKPRPVAGPAPVTARTPQDAGPRVVPVPHVAAPKSEPVPIPVPVPRAAPARDPIAELIAPPQRVSAVQRALNDYGYGPLKVTGVFGPETVAAIEKFERQRKLAVTGQISARLLKELATVIGRPVE